MGNELAHRSGQPVQDGHIGISEGVSVLPALPPGVVGRVGGDEVNAGRRHPKHQGQVVADGEQSGDVA